MKLYGTRQVSFRTFDQQKITITFLVADVQRPILSVGKLLQRGYRVRFQDEETAFIENKDGLRLMMTRDKNSYVLRVRNHVRQMQKTDPERLVFPVEQQEESAQEVENKPRLLPTPPAPPGPAEVARHNATH